MVAYYAEMERLSLHVLRVLARSLHVDEDFFDSKIDRHSSNLQVANYSSQLEEPTDGLLRVKAHADSGSITILDREASSEAASGGLEVLNRDGAWVRVPHRESELLVNLGNLMARWTDGAWVSTKHRVTNPQAGRRTRRLSLAYFQKPNYDAVCDPRDVLGTRCSGEYRAARVAELSRVGILWRLRHMSPQEAAARYHDFMLTGKDPLAPGQ